MDAKIALELFKSPAVMTTSLIDGCELFEELDPLLVVVPVTTVVVPPCPDIHGLMKCQKIASAPFDYNCMDTKFVLLLMMTLLT